MPVKKKKKPKKATKELASAAAASKKQTDTPEEVLQLFLHRVRVWMDTNYSRVVDVFRHFDLDGDGFLSHEEFIIGMRDLSAPLTVSEIQMLLGLMDRDQNGQIDLMEFEQVFRGGDRTDGGDQLEDMLSSRTTLIQERNKLLMESNRLEKCPNCEIGLPKFPVEKELMYVNVHMVLGPFQHTTCHPGHFTTTVTTSTTVHGLKENIREHLGYCTHQVLAIFTDSSCSQSSFLAPHLTLEECGIKGSRNKRQSRRELYYDFGTEFNDCPILMAENGIRNVELPSSTGLHYSRTTPTHTKYKIS